MKINFMYAHSFIKSMRQRRQERLKFLSNKKLYGSSSHVVATLLVLLACLAASVYYWYGVRGSMQGIFSKDSEQTIGAAEQAIGTRMQVYTNIMTGGAGLFNASDNVTRAEWSSFISAYHVQERYPGVQGFGYGQYVLPQDLATHVEQVRSTDIPEYSVKDTGSDHPYIPILYIEPFNEMRRSVLGFDMASEPTRKTALLRARDTGEMSMTGKVVLIQSKDGGSTNQEPGIILYTPIYKHGMPTSTVVERQAAISGYIYSSLRVNELLKGIFGNEGNKNLAIQIYDGDKKVEENLMYRSTNFDAISREHGSMQKERVLDISDHKWIISYALSPNILSPTDRDAPWQTLLRGVLISLTVAAVVYYLLTNRTRKLMRAQQAEVQTAKDDLLSLASHQLRTPATVVKQYVGMLLQGYGGKLTAQQKDMLNSAYVSNERQLQIINQILYVARLDAGQLRLQKERFDIVKLVRDISKEHEASIRESNQKLIRKLPRTKIDVNADPQYLSMAIDNLISNANKYTPEGGKVTVELTHNDGKVVLNVADTGVGISPEEAEHIFEKFTRGQNELLTEVGGSGIGLYLVKQIAELHKGTITAQSAHPKGSVFTLTLPIKTRKAR